MGLQPQLQVWHRNNPLDSDTCHWAYEQLLHDGKAHDVLMICKQNMRKNSASKSGEIEMQDEKTRH